MKKMILILLPFSFAFSYWEEIEIKLKNENLKRENPIYFEIKEPKSIKIYIKKIGDEADIYIYKDGKEYKNYKIKEDKEIKVFLESGKYTLKTIEGNFNVKVFELKKISLKSLESYQGFPITVLTNGKKYKYYKIDKDTSSIFKIEGPETLYIYLRGNFDKNGKRLYDKFIAKIFINDKEIFSKEFKGKVSRKSNYVENKEILPSEVEKIKMEVPEGINFVKILLAEGKGCVKVYVKKNKKNLKFQF